MKAKAKTKKQVGNKLPTILRLTGKSIRFQYTGAEE
jgi:hypothetical protein